jgi:hypothetical protein
MCCWIVAEPNQTSDVIAVRNLARYATRYFVCSMLACWQLTCVGCGRSSRAIECAITVEERATIHPFITQDRRALKTLERDTKAYATAAEAHIRAAPKKGYTIAPKTRMQAQWRLPCLRMMAQAGLRTLLRAYGRIPQLEGWKMILPGVGRIFDAAGEVNFFLQFLLIKCIQSKVYNTV